MDFYRVSHVVSFWKSYTSNYLENNISRDFMIQDKQLAKYIIDMTRLLSANINNSIRIVQEKCANEEEFNKYKLVAGKIMGEMFLEIMEPIYKIHPELEPEILKNE